MKIVDKRLGMSKKLKDVGVGESFEILDDAIVDSTFNGFYIRTDKGMIVNLATGESYDILLFGESCPVREVEMELVIVK